MLIANRRRQHDDRRPLHRRMGAQFAEHGQSVFLGHADVEHDGVGMVFQRGGNCLPRRRTRKSRRSRPPANAVPGIG